jgi:DNA-binding winged helix-turn-helix (wHTH) protein
MNAESIARGFAFGPYRLLPWQRLLLESDRPVKLGSRALEILTVLVENAGEIVGKALLMRRVSPDNIVEEAALRVRMAALRKILGDGREGRRYIATVPQRGYSFVAPVHPLDAPLPIMHLNDYPTAKVLELSGAGLSS